MNTESEEYKINCFTAGVGYCQSQYQSSWISLTVEAAHMWNTALKIEAESFTGQKFGFYGTEHFFKSVIRTPI